jgi:hypothetical protein
MQILSEAKTREFAKYIAREIDNRCEVNDTILVVFEDIEAVVSYKAEVEEWIDPDIGWRTYSERVIIADIYPTYEDYTDEQLSHLRKQLENLLN